MTIDRSALTKHQTQFSLRTRTVDLYNKTDRSHGLLNTYGVGRSFLTEMEDVSTTIN